MGPTMHALLTGLDHWRAELEAQLPDLDEDARAFLAWELHRAAEAVERPTGPCAQAVKRPAKQEAAGTYPAHDAELLSQERTRARAK